MKTGETRRATISDDMRRMARSQLPDPFEPRVEKLLDELWDAVDAFCKEAVRLRCNFSLEAHSEEDTDEVGRLREAAVNAFDACLGR